jgi:hypothetical protein
MFCSDQYIIGGAGAVAINFLAVDRAMDYFNIAMDERVEFYEKVRLLSSTVLSLQHREQDEKMKASRRK